MLIKSSTKTRFGGFKWNTSSRVGKIVHRTIFTFVSAGPRPARNLATSFSIPHLLMHFGTALLCLFGGFKWNASSRVGKIVHWTIFAFVSVGPRPTRNLATSFSIPHLLMHFGTALLCLFGGFKQNVTFYIFLSFFILSFIMLFKALLEHFIKYNFL